MNPESNNAVPDLNISFSQRCWRQIKEIKDIVVLRSQITETLPSDVKPNDLFKRFDSISRNICCAHNPSHALAFVLDMLKSPGGIDGVFVEAGCFKGGSTAKFSIIAKILGKRLVVFDSFCGLPVNTEAHLESLQGHSINGWFEGGAFAAELAEVKRNVEEYGEPDVCVFVQGWFDETMPGFKENILAGFLDVDLASSTRTCLKYLYPKLVSNGVLCSQDGDFPLVVEVFKDRQFWMEELDGATPLIEGLGQKITRIRKP